MSENREARKETTRDLPRWCGRCTTNGYHAPEHCPERPAAAVTAEMIERAARAYHAEAGYWPAQKDIRGALRAALGAPDA